MVRSRRYLLLVLALAVFGLLALPLSASAQDIDCSDLVPQPQEQAILDANPSDPNRLDANNDGVACEEDGASTDTSFTDASTDEYAREAAPIRGVASGGGSMAQNSTSPLPLLISGGVFALLALGTWGLSLRRRLGR